MKTLLVDIRDAYSGYRWSAAGAVLVALVAVASLAVGQWVTAVVMVSLAIHMVVVRVLGAALEVSHDEWDKTRRRMNDIDTMLTVERHRAEAEAYRADIAEEARTDARFDLAQALADLDSAPSTGADIRHMCTAFGQDVHDTLNRPDDAVRGLRVALLSEEFREYMEAERSANIVEIADALADMTVVIYGTAAAYGIDLDACCAEVYRSNMTKLNADGDVIRDSRGKVMKPESYEPPQIARIIGHVDDTQSAA